MEEVVISPGMSKLVRTGLAMAIPESCYGRIAPRSGLAVKKGIDTLAGVIDADYRGEVGVCLVNHGAKEVSFSKGDKIAQIILERISTPLVVEVERKEDLGRTERGTGGFGSTGERGREAGEGKIADAMEDVVTVVAVAVPASTPVD